MIEFRAVSYEIEDVSVLESISCLFADDEFVVLAGANGSGKTTLLRHCNGLLTPTAGSVLVDGTPVADDLVAARTAVGMVFQHPRDQFVAATVGADIAFGPENLGLERAEIDRRVADALAAVRLEGRETDRIDTLSGGEQSRVAIAGALAMEPTHLVLDEPFTGLDEPARTAVLERLAGLSRQGTGIVLATHDLRDVLALADRVVVVDDGRVGFDGTPEAARESLEDFDVHVPEPTRRASG
ncbi:energy-coupling factor ABC transporter ATP-binding protein [Natronosalvus rutilus]|uniref:Energy-coupling factor ABC transporter ATP-binding protein n=1 Tax=Natronosalvus rutilus TaxID=2953753 RepID=A0A9E7SXH7_9EURY|nr:ABC transporter ATP-binding protein [Natronosalvus rutilus]UTF55076.1 energy-coupling factor ABC transporter ATP-binding protein [Natronosalvus rutilus]